MKNFLFFLVLLISAAICKAETWTPVGQVQWTEGALTGYSSKYNKTWNVSVERSDLNAQVYRLQPYASHPLINVYNGTDKYDNVYVILNVENPQAIYIEYYKFNHDGGYYYHIFQRCPENGADNKYYGKITSNNTIEFPIGSFAIKENTNASNISSIPSDAKYSTCVHKIVFPEGVLDYVPQEETWVNIGKGEWVDPFWTYNNEPSRKEVDIEKSTLNPDKYRLRPFEEYVIIHAENPSVIYVTPYTHTNTSGTAITITQNCKENDLSGSQYGTLENGKIVIPGNYFVKTWSGGTETCDASRSCIITLPDGFDNPLPEDNGVFMGIIAFNEEVTRKQISFLNENTKADFTSFVDGLEMSNATLLYYAVDQAINSMQAQSFPENLSNAILVTFTDGLDQGSLAMKPEHRTSRGYASYLADRIAQTSIQGCPLEAYAIGLKGNDVVDDELFMYNLSSLASKSKTEGGTDNEYISSVNNITELQQQLTTLYNNLDKQTTQRVVSIKVPMMSHGSIYRYTLDIDRETQSVTDSEIWFEGTFNIDNLSLENVTYHGFTSTSGTTINTTQEGIRLKFDITDCRTSDGELLPIDNDKIDQFEYLPTHDKWQPNVEKIKAGDVKVEDIKSSVAIMFALDCSTSLGDLFPLVKTTANSFINQLAGANDESVIEDVIVNRDETLDINDPSVEIYNLQGVRVSNPTSGIYICRKGNLVKKILVR